MLGHDSIAEDPIAAVPPASAAAIVLLVLERATWRRVWGRIWGRVN